jgi:uncharacterized protein YbaP (TraB family)
VRPVLGALGWLLPLAGAVACATRPPDPPAPPPPAAFYWTATSPERGTLFLLGSVHIGDGRELALDPRIANDWAYAEALVVEGDPFGMPDLERLEVFQRYGLLPPTLTLRDVIDAETWQALATVLRDHRFPIEAASRMRPWMLAQILVQHSFAAAGYDPENGVDAWFVRRAEAEGLPVFALETLDEQMASFAALTPEVEGLLLQGMLEQRDVFVETTHEILRAWERGDEARLLELLLGVRNDPVLADFHRTVFIERNWRMADRLRLLAADGRARFVVIGTGHLIGPESIPALLAAQGFHVERFANAFVRAVPLEPVIPDSVPSPVPGPESEPAP